MRKNQKENKILIFHIGLLGDTIVSIPALRAIRRHYGDAAQITLLHSSHGVNLVNARDVLDNLSLVDKFLEYPFSPNPIRRLKVMSQLALALRRENFDCVVSLLPCFRPTDSIRRDQAFFRLCGIKTQIGFRAYNPATELYPRGGDGLPAYVPQEAVRRLTRMQNAGVRAIPEIDLQPPLIRLSDSIEKKVQAWLEENRKFPARKLIAVCPKSNMPAKEWELERFAEIGRRLIALGSFELVVIGGADAHAAGDRLTRLWGEGINAAGALSVLESGGVLRQCEFMIGLDTGTMHLASALNVPTVSLHSSHNNPGEWFPLGAGHLVVRHPVPCAGCRLEVCAVPGHPCLKEIGVNAVWEVIEKFMLSNLKPETVWKEIVV